MARQRPTDTEAAKLHEKAIENIKEKGGVDGYSTKVAAIKALIYQKIKEQFPKHNHLERAKELEKRTADANTYKQLDKTLIKNLMEEIKKYKEEKAKKEKDDTGDKKTKDKKKEDSKKKEGVEKRK